MLPNPATAATLTAFAGTTKLGVVARDAVDRVLWSLAGDLPGFEEASRAFRRREPERFAERIAARPTDERDYVRELARHANALDALTKAVA